MREVDEGFVEFVHNQSVGFQFILKGQGEEVFGDDFGGLGDEFLVGEAGVAVCGCELEDIVKCGACSFGRVEGEADSFGDLIGCLEADTLDFESEPVGISFYGLDGFFAVFLVEAVSDGVAETYFLKEEDDIV